MLFSLENRLSAFFADKMFESLLLIFFNFKNGMKNTKTVYNTHTNKIITEEED